MNKTTEPVSTACPQCHKAYYSWWVYCHHCNYTPKDDRTTDEWAEQEFPQFVKDVDTHIEMLSDLKGVDAYPLRRMITISLRDALRTRYADRTDEVERLKEQVKKLTRTREEQTAIDSAQFQDFGG